ncbi:FeoB-associated Cys-rich membrane protein [bacterium]|nr:FeoB-associated Cys-rich membrane protein [bacterium]
MWQDILVGVIVALAAAYAVRQIVRNLSGRRACDADSCAGCPFGGECEHKGSEEKP